MASFYDLSIGFGNCSDSVVFFFPFSFMAITEDGRKKNETLEIDIKKQAARVTLKLKLDFIWLYLML